MSVRVYLGVTGSGKTTLALRHAREGPPFLAVDPLRIGDSWGLPRARNGIEAVRAVLRRGSIVWSPASGDELDRALDRLYRASALGARRGILIDECWEYCSYRALSPILREGLRAHRHYRLDWYLTTQIPCDLHAAVFAADPLAHIFRLRRVRDIERVVAEWGLDPEKIKRLGVGEHLVAGGGFRSL